MNAIENLPAPATPLPVGFRPIGARLLIRPDKVADKTRGGLYLAPATVAALTKQADRGTVLAMGPGMLMKNGKRWPMPDCKEGDRVLFLREGAIEVKVGDETLLSVRDDFVFAVEVP